MWSNIGNTVRLRVALSSGTIRTDLQLLYAYLRGMPFLVRKGLSRLWNEHLAKRVLDALDNSHHQVI